MVNITSEELTKSQGKQTSKEATERNYKTTRKQSTKWHKHMHIDNYFKCKQTKFSNQKTQSGWMDEESKSHIYVAYKRLTSD